MRRYLVPSVIALTGVMVAVAWWQEARPPRRNALLVVTPTWSTTRADLIATVRALEQRVSVHGDDGDAVVRLAQALTRLQRVNHDAAAAVEAEEHLRRFLSRHPSHYEAQRELGSVLLSQHRFRDAIVEAERVRAIDPRDAWNYGVIGDAHLELGRYAEAFAAFDRMGALRPGPSAYARVAYALELKGELDLALESMRMAADSTSAHDAEAQAWHYSQLGTLLLQKGRFADARREYERAAATFPNHPYALTGLARVKIAEGDRHGALRDYQQLFEQAPSPELAFVIGDLHRHLGAAAAAEAMYVEGERLEREGWASEEPQPQALSRFLSERGRKIADAIALAEEAARKRRDIHTMDALAWAYFQAGQLPKAREASDEAIRTGTRDARVLAHAAAIRRQQGDAAAGRELLARAAYPLPELTLIP